jgi:hypothetical protein
MPPNGGAGGQPQYAARPMNACRPHLQEEGSMTVPLKKSLARKSPSRRAKIGAEAKRMMKREFDDQRDPEVNAFISTFEAFVRKEYGPRCKMVAPGCKCCEMWAAFDLVNTMLM